jgi:glycosyltransferase involved in cell wall biosynthesis
VAQVNCVIDEHDRGPPELIEAWPTLSLIAEAAAGAGAEVHVVQSSRTRAMHRFRGVTYDFVPEPRLLRGTGPGIMPGRLTRELSRIEPDVIHFHGLEAPLHLRAVSRLGAPVLVQDHASTPRRRAKRARRWSLEGVAACSFTSALQAAPFAAAGHLPRHVRILEVAESSTRFTAGDQRAARVQSGVFGNPALLWVGHLNANKDPLTILRAVRLALRQLPELQLWCAFGSAALLPELETLLAEEPTLREHVHLLGNVPHGQVEILCRACDMSALGSHHESCGYALLEALACGLAPIVTDIPAFRALTGGGNIGSLVAPGDVEGFAAAIVAQARSLDAAQREAVLAHFDARLSPAALGKRLLAVYRALADAGPRR